MSTNLEVVLTDSPQLTVYSGLRLLARSEDENGAGFRERFGVGCALIITLNLVGYTIYLYSSCDTRLMYARTISRDLIYGAGLTTNDDGRSWIPLKS